MPITITAMYEDSIINDDKFNVAYVSEIVARVTNFHYMEPAPWLWLTISKD